MYLPPKICTEGICVLSVVYCIDVEDVRRKCWNDKIWSILSSKSNHHTNGKYSTEPSEDGQLKTAQHRRAMLHGTYGWLSHKDIYAWVKLWKLLPSCNRVIKMMSIKKVLVMMTLLNTFRMMDICPIMRMIFHPNILPLNQFLSWDGISSSLFN